MKKVLITGISGFVGKHLAQQLLATKEYEIIGTYHSDNSKEKLIELKDTVTLEQVNLTDKDAVTKLISNHKPDWVFHLAAQSAPSLSFKMPAETLTTNILSQLYILEAIKNNNLTGTRILIVGTSEEYGKVRPEDLPIKETAPLGPVSPYAVSKIAQDYLGLQYYLAHKMEIIRVRPFNHIGPGQEAKFALPSWCKQIAEIEKNKMEPIMKVGNLEAKRDFTDVRDIVKAHILALEKGQAGDVYNLGTGKSYAMKEVLDMLLSLSTVKISIEQDPALMRPADVPDLVCDSEKFRNLTGWKPEISLQETLKDILDYWRSIV